MQLRLSVASCGFVDKSIATGTFDWWTQNVLADFQRSYKIKGEVSAGSPVYGPKTRAALESDPGDC
ncbi:peptidoglycan-binding domain-containing protein [Kitasatospora aburaviensis]